jgi:TetR/AcrR family transcriptional repressor of nem operon
MPRSKEFEPETVLEQAVDLFWSQGYEATSVRDLQQRMGISRQSLYDTFGDKRQLFLSCLDRYRQMLEPMLEELEAEATLEAIRLYLETVIHVLAGSDEPRACLLSMTALELGLEADVRPALEAHLGRVKGAFATALAGAIGEGTIAADLEIDAAADFLASAAQGLGILVKSGASGSELRRVVDMALRALTAP